MNNAKDAYKCWRTNDALMINETRADNSCMLDIKFEFSQKLAQVGQNRCTCLNELVVRCVPGYLSSNECVSPIFRVR